MSLYSSYNINIIIIIITIRPFVKAFKFNTENTRHFIHKHNSVHSSITQLTRHCCHPPNIGVIHCQSVFRQCMNSVRYFPIHRKTHNSLALAYVKSLAFAISIPWLNNFNSSASIRPSTKNHK